MGVRFAVLSTYPPTRCGIATFAEALVTQLSAAGAHVGVVRVVDEPEVQVLPVVQQWQRGSAWSTDAAVRVLDDHDVVILQHEYGIFGGADGAEVVDLVRRLRTPVVTVLHTVLTHPTPHQFEVLADLIAASAALVTMTETGRDRLVAGWDVDPARVSVIPHGAHDNRTHRPAPASPAGRPTMLTWGLLSQGKGIEWALQALGALRGHVPLPLYRVVGRTHPTVLERDGESYRSRLVAMTRDLGLAGDVEFDDRYLTQEQLAATVASADLVLLPYDSLEQVTSGVLTEAVAAGRPVISTAFPHAVELLASGAGILVPQSDPVALAAALRRVLTEPGLAEGMARTSRGLAHSLLWSTVGRRYLDLGQSLVRGSHLIEPQRAAV
ncbi:MAG TPA: glycosyltransferase [Candidatus Nanopelagicales bacterium]|nr:glycosyltransferase [Candidatus Nanopelagicales bacterium]